jgi:hypothetical protein
MVAGAEDAICCCLPTKRITMLGFGATDSDRVAAESKRTQRHGTEIQSIVVCGHGHGSTAQQCGAAAPYAARPLLLYGCWLRCWTLD